MNKLNLRLLVLVPITLSLVSCAAGNTSFTQETPAGFWYGLWHGIISVISLLIHVFNDSVAVYESHNTGGWYDFGFLLGVISIWGGGSHASCKSAAKSREEKEWDEIGDKVEQKIMRKLRAWVEDEGISPDADCDEIGEKVEKKIKRKIREWAERE